MGLRDIAKADNKYILEDDAAGWRWPLIVTAPDGTTLGDDPESPFYGFSNDVGVVIDPDTGVPVSGRLASATMHQQTLIDAFGELPRAIADETAKPWLIQFDDINGLSHTFKVRESMPDRTVGMLLVYLELYNDEVE